MEKLQYLATKCVCVELIYEWADNDTIPIVNMWKDEGQNITCPDHDFFLWQMYEMPLPQSLMIPTPIKNEIDDTLPRLLDPIRTWVRYHHVMHCFHEGEADSLNEYIKSIVWTKDYKIDYTATAKKISSNVNIDLLGRFRFACTYCFVEDLENFAEVASIVKTINFTAAPFMVYWSKYVTNELSTLSDLKIDLELTSLFEKSSLEISTKKAQEEMTPAMNGSIEGLLFELGLMSYELWPPVEYFFTKLEPALRIRRFNGIIERCGKRDRQELLAKLTDEQWIAAGRHSIRNLIVLNRDHFEDVRYIWTQFKDHLNSKNFCDMISELITLSMKNPANFNTWTPFLFEIWNNAASDKFKRAASDPQLWSKAGERIIFEYIPLEEKSDFCSRRRIPDPMKFIRLVLSRMDETTREIFLQKNFFWLIIWQPFESTRKLIKEFIVPRNIIKFKNELKDSNEVERSLSVLLAFAEFEEFDAIAAYRFSGKSDNISVSHQHLVCYKWAVLVPPSGMESMSMCLYFIGWRKLFEYVKNTFKNLAIPPDSYVITLFELGCIRHHIEEKICKGEVRDIMECVSTILSSTDSRLPDLKARFKKALYFCLFDMKYMELMNFKSVDIQDFLLWLYNGNQALIEKNFKKPELLRKGFLVQFKTCIKEERVFEASDSMEEFLKWCFPTEEERASFKRKMIYKYRKYESIKNLLWLRRFRRPMLYWFFDNDTKMINEFLTKRVVADKNETEKAVDAIEAEKVADESEAEKAVDAIEAEKVADESEAEKVADENEAEKSTISLVTI